MMDDSDRSIKYQLRAASKANATFAIIIGEDELNTGLFTMKDLKIGDQDKCREDELSFNEILHWLKMGDVEKFQARLMEIIDEITSDVSTSLDSALDRRDSFKSWIDGLMQDEDSDKREYGNIINEQYKIISKLSSKKMIKDTVEKLAEIAARTSIEARKPK